MATAAIDHKKLLINNDWRDAAGGKTMDVVNPATEEVIATVASADKSDVDDAVAARPRGAERAVGHDVGPRARTRSSASSPIG